nr:er membrane protein complex subunit 4 [Quercus suber]
MIVYLKQFVQNSLVMASIIPSPQPRWVRDLTSVPPTRPRNSTLGEPPGFTSTTALQPSKKSSSKAPVSIPRKQPSPEEMDTLKLKKAWELALAPAKQLPMNAIGMYMSGNSLQIFSIMMVFMLFKGPITAVFNIQGTFQRLETDSNKGQMVIVKLAFVACNVLALALGIWKVNGMGLLP